MISSKHGSNTSVAEITHVSSNGIWVLVQDEELFMSYDQFPWFKDQPLKHVLHVEEPTLGHLYWPDIDVDLSMDIIKNPERFPLQSR